MNKDAIAKLIDQSLLRPDASEGDIKKLCLEAVKYGFHSVCVNPCHVQAVKMSLSGSPVKITAVVGFPLGADLTASKVYEAMQLSLLGAEELDIVINIGWAKAGKWKEVGREISDIIAISPGLAHKVIIECCYLSKDEKVKAVEACLEAGAEFIKTSTGFGPGGATVEDVRLIKEIAGRRAGIKAAGGIKTLADLLSMVEAGATRIGTSNGAGIVREAGIE